METFASPRTAEAAGNVLQAIEEIKQASYHLAASNEFETWAPLRRASYWDYAEAAHAFMLAARSEMGLKPLSVPPGLARWRADQRSTGQQGGRH
jgi:hypothetical protein